jgi:hypothetical protein
MTHTMRMPRGAKLPLLVAVSAVLAILAAGAWAVGIQEIRFGIATGGGGTSTSGTLAMKGIVGQPVVSTSSGGTLVLRSGHLGLFEGAVSAVPGTESEVPATSRLNSLYPNPFNPMTNVSFELATAGPVRARIYDSRGQLVRDLVQGEWPAGRHLVQWDGKTDQGATASSGVYFLRFEAAGLADTRKMTLLK